MFNRPLLLLLMLISSLHAFAAERVIQLGHTGPVGALAFFPDGETLASQAQDQSIRLWHRASGRLIRAIRDQYGFAAVLAVSPDGKRLAAAGLDSSVRLIDPATGETLFRSPPMGDVVRGIDFSPSGDRLVACTEGQRAQLFTVPDGKVVAEQKEHLFTACRFVGPETIALGGLDESSLGGDGGIDYPIHLWDLKSGAFNTPFTGNRGVVTSLALSPDGKRLYAGLLDSKGTIRAWDLKTRKPVQTLKGHEQGVMGIALSPDGKQLASASHDKSAILWELKSGKPIRRFQGHEDHLLSIAFSPHGGEFATGGKEKRLLLWSTAETQPVRTFGSAAESATAVAFLPDGRRALIANWDGSLSLWDLDKRERVQVLPGHDEAISTIAVSADGRFAVSGGKRPGVRLWSLERMELLRDLPGLDFGVLAVAFSPDGKRIAAGGLDDPAKMWKVADGTYPEGFTETLVLWDAESGKSLWRAKGSGFGVMSLRFTPDGAGLLVGTGNDELKVWDVQSGEHQRTLKLNASPLTLAYGPDGKSLAAAGPGGQLELIDLERFEVIGELPCYLRAAFLPSGALLCQDKKGDLVEWAMPSGEEQRRISNPVGVIAYLDHSADGRRLLTTHADGASRLWDREKGEIIASLMGDRGEAWFTWSPNGEQTGSPGAEARFVNRVEGLRILPPADGEGPR